MHALITQIMHERSVRCVTVNNGRVRGTGVLKTENSGVGTGPSSFRFPIYMLEVPYKL